MSAKRTTLLLGLLLALSACTKSVSRYTRGTCPSSQFPEAPQLMRELGLIALSHGRALNGYAAVSLNHEVWGDDTWRPKTTLIYAYDVRDKSRNHDCPSAVSFRVSYPPTEAQKKQLSDFITYVGSQLKAPIPTGPKHLDCVLNKTCANYAKLQINAENVLEIAQMHDPLRGQIFEIGWYSAAFYASYFSVQK